MKTSLFATLLLASSLALAATKTTFKTMHVAELQKAMTGEVHIFDANTPDTRKKEGKIPGAHLLDKVATYDTSMLPDKKDTALVFYCANTMCNASHEAAQHAIDAGYTNVSVMVDGIQGWKKAGQKTEKVD